MQFTDARPNFGRIDFEGLPNTRDLGGLPAADGRRVRPGLLLRSGTLYFATTADRRRLIEDYHLRAVVDLRGEDELAEYPDGVESLPASATCTPTRSGARSPASRRTPRPAPSWRPRAQTTETLRASWRWSTRTSCWGSPASRPIARCCAACWRPRTARSCGIATSGATAAAWAACSWRRPSACPGEAVEGDYLATNRFNPDPADERTDANLRFIRAAVAAVTREFGGVMGYVHDALGVSDADVAELRGRCLEGA